MGNGNWRKAWNGVGQNIVFFDNIFLKNFVYFQKLHFSPCFTQGFSGVEFHNSIPFIR